MNDPDIAPADVSLTELAQTYAQRKYRVFPLHAATDAVCSCAKRKNCREPGRHPRIADWAIRATSDTTTIKNWWKRWPNANVGIIAAESGKYIKVDSIETIPNGKTGDPLTLQFPAGKEFQDAYRAFVSSEHWVTDGTVVPYYVDNLNGLTYSIGGYRDDAPAKNTSLTRRSLQTDMSILEPATQIVLIVAIAKWIAARHEGTLDEKGTVTISVDEILGLMGRQKHSNGGYRTEQKVDIAKRLEQLDNFRISSDISNKDGEFRIRGRILNVTLKDKKDEKQMRPYVCWVRPGDAFYDKLVSNTQELASFFCSLVQLDTTRPGGVERMAFLIGSFLVFQYPTDGRTSSNPHTGQIGSILQQARIPIQSDPRLYSRFRDQFEGAMDLLGDQGVHDGWMYHPAEFKRLPTRAWFQPWLAMNIIISPPTVKASISSSPRRKSTPARLRA